MAVSAGLACVPAPVEVDAPSEDEVHAFVLIERADSLEVHRVDGAQFVRARRSAAEVWHLLTVPRANVAAAHPLFDEARERDVGLRVSSGEDQESCAERGVLDESGGDAPVLEFDAKSLESQLHRLEDDTWVRADFPSGGALARLVVRIPIRETCRTRRWGAEPFFARSPIYQHGDQVRDFTFTREWPRALEVRKLLPLGDGALLIFTPAVLTTASPGEALLPDRALLPSDLPAPPPDWRPVGIRELAWQFQDTWPTGTSTSGGRRFLLLAQVRERGGEQEGDVYGHALFELQSRDGRLSLGRVLHQAADVAPDAILHAAPLGEEGGFVAIGPKVLIAQDTSSSVPESWFERWSPVTVRQVGGPETEIMISVSTGGFWVGDPRRGFEGLRFEMVEPGIEGCDHMQRTLVGEESWVLAACGRTRLLARREGAWHRVEPWIPEAPGCNRPAPVCGRPAPSETSSVHAFQPGLEANWMLSKDGCPHLFSFELDDDACSLAEVFDFERLRQPLDRVQPSQLSRIEDFDGDRVALGHGGLAARVVPIEDADLE